MIDNSEIYLIIGILCINENIHSFLLSRAHGQYSYLLKYLFIVKKDST